MVAYDGGGGTNDPGLIAASLRGGLILGGCTASDEAARSGQCASLREAAGDYALQEAESNAGSWTKAGAALASDLLSSPAARTAYDFTYRWGPIVASVGCYGASFAVSAGTLAIACTVGLSAAESVIVAIEYRRGNKGSAGVQASLRSQERVALLRPQNSGLPAGDSKAHA